jgi:hypothetical protein
MLIYVAGPYSKGDIAENVSKAIWVGHEVMDYGHTPIVPHLSHFMHLVRQRAYEEWMTADFELIRRCDVLVRIEGESAGSDIEVDLADQLGIPVVYQLGNKWVYKTSNGTLLSALNLVACDRLEKQLKGQ